MSGSCSHWLTSIVTLLSVSPGATGDAGNLSADVIYTRRARIYSILKQLHTQHALPVSPAPPCFSVCAL